MPDKANKNGGDEDPYTHTIRGFWDIRAVIDGLQRAEFNLRPEDYSYGNPGARGIKLEGRSSLLVIF